MATYARIYAHSDSEDELASAPLTGASVEHHTHSMQHQHDLTGKTKSEPAIANLISFDESDEETPGASEAAHGDVHAPGPPNPHAGTSPTGHAADTGDASGSTERPKLTPVIDFEETDSAGAQKRELLIYAVPLFRSESSPVDGLVFLPVSSFKDEPDYRGVGGAIQEKLSKLQDAAADAWDALRQKEQGTLGNKVYKVGKRVINDLTPEERLMKNIPKNCTKVIIYHPTQVPPDAIMEKLTSMTSKHGVLSGAKAAIAGLMLPVAFGIDILIIPGPQVLTYYTSFLLYKNTSAAVGGQRLTKYIKQEGDAADVRVCYAGDHRLDRFYEASFSHNPEGMLSEDDCEALVEVIHEQELLEPLLELRARHERESGKTASGGYSRLPTTMG